MSTATLERLPEDFIAFCDDYDGRGRTASSDQSVTVYPELAAELLQRAQEAALKTYGGKFPLVRPEQVEVTVTDEDYCYGEVLLTAELVGLDCGYARTDGAFRLPSGELDEPYTVLPHYLRIPTPEHPRGSWGPGPKLSADIDQAIAQLQAAVAERFNHLVRRWDEEDFLVHLI